MKHFYPAKTLLSKTTYDHLIDLIKRGENVTTLWLPGMGRTALCGELQNQEDNGTISASTPVNNLTFIHLDLGLSEYFLEKELVETLEMYSDKNGMRQKIKELIDQGRQIVFLLDNFNFNNPEFIKYLYSFKNIAQQKISFVLLALESDFIANSKAKDTIMSHNVIKMKYFSREEAADWLKINSRRHQLKLQEKDFNNIYDFSGGIPAIMRACLRGYSVFDNLVDIVRSSSMHNILNIIWGNFTTREKFVIKNIFMKHKIPSYKNEVLYLKEHNLINTKNKISGEWVKIVMGSSEMVEIKLDNKGELIWENYYLNDLLTAKESKIFIYLLNNPEMFATREEIATQLWKDTESYSDWAMDQLFSRLRKKLENIGLGSEIIETRRKKGFKVNRIKLIKT